MPDLNKLEWQKHGVRVGGIGGIKGKKSGLFDMINRATPSN